MNESHISSIIVYFQPQSLNEVQNHIEAINNAEFHPDQETAGKAVAVFECDSLNQTKNIIETLQQLNGVHTVSMIYHHAESNEALEENIA